MTGQMTFASAHCKNNSALLQRLTGPTHETRASAACKQTAANSLRTTN